MFSAGGYVDNANNSIASRWSGRYFNPLGVEFFQYSNAFEMEDMGQTFYEYLSGGGAYFAATAAGHDSLQITGSGVTSLVPLAAAGGISSYPQDAFNTGTNVTEAAGIAYVQWNPGAAGTLTLPPVSTRAYFTLLVPANNTQVKKVATAGVGNINVGASAGNSTWTWPNGYPGAVTFYSDGANWQVLNPIGTTKTCTAAPTVVAGVVTSC